MTFFHSFSSICWRYPLNITSSANDAIGTASGTFLTDLEFYQAEARFLRAFSYWHAIDMFGNVPFVTEDDLPGAFYPERIVRTDLFTYVESELLDF